MRRLPALVLLAPLALVACKSSLGGRRDAPNSGFERLPSPAAPIDFASRLDVRDVLTESMVPLREALAAALAVRPGVAVEAGLGNSVTGADVAVSFEVAIVGSDGVAYEVFVSPSTGRVVGLLEANEFEETVRIAETRAAIGDDHLPLADLLARASKDRDGTPVKVGFRGKRFPGQAKVMFVKDGQVEVLTLDARTGAVVAPPAPPAKK